MDSSNKVSLNTRIGHAEHIWLKDRAKKNGTTITIELRRLIWQEQAREAALKSREK